jgi:hypothetical protein
MSEILGSAPLRTLRMRILCSTLLFTLGATCLACSTTPTPRLATASKLSNEAAGAALGPSYVLIPLPGEDDTLLGRVLDAPPVPGHSIEETARANPCLDKLSPASTTPLVNEFSDAQDLSASATAHAAIGAFGFHGDAQGATHFLYKLKTEKRMSRVDTPEYATCCKEKGCGMGYVSALVYGKGEYATGQQTSASGGVSGLVVAGGDGQIAVHIVEKRNVQGWLAALVTISDRTKVADLSPLGIAQAAGITDATVPQQVKDIYEHNKMQVDGSGGDYAFKVASGEAITENEFVRRYRTVTGSSDLDDAEKRRNWGAVALWGSLEAVAAGVVVYGLATTQRACVDTDAKLDGGGVCNTTAANPNARPGFFGGTYYDPTKTTANEWTPVILVSGAAGMIGFGIPLVIALLNPDGGTSSHSITDADARVFAARYNRALLRKTVKDVQATGPAEPSLTLVPLVGFGTMGVAGRF